jgi:hypothetical protein
MPSPALLQLSCGSWISVRGRSTRYRGQRAVLKGLLRACCVCCDAGRWQCGLWQRGSQESGPRPHSSRVQSIQGLGAVPERLPKQLAPSIGGCSNAFLVSQVLGALGRLAIASLSSRFWQSMGAARRGIKGFCSCVCFGLRRLTAAGRPRLSKSVVLLHNVHSCATAGEIAPAAVALASL